MQRLTRRWDTKRFALLGIQKTWWCGTLLQVWQTEKIKIYVHIYTLLPIDSLLEYNRQYTCMYSMYIHIRHIFTYNATSNKLFFHEWFKFYAQRAAAKRAQQVDRLPSINAHAPALHGKCFNSKLGEGGGVSACLVLFLGGGVCQMLLYLFY